MTTPMDYCKRLLDDSLKWDDLRRLAFSLVETEKEFFAASGIRYDSRKPALLDFVAEALASERIELSSVALKICRRPYAWFTMLTGGMAQLPQQASLHTFFLTDDEGWFGPLNDPDAGSTLYIWRRNVADYVPLSPLDSSVACDDAEDSSDDDPDRAPTSSILVRVQRPWCVILEIFPRYTVLSWNGFSHRTEEADDTPNQQFPFWLDIKKLLESMPEWLFGLVLIDPYALILNNLWDRYRNNPAYSWEDVGARSEQDGVAMSARAGGGSRKGVASDGSMTLKGIAMLAERLAYAALDRLNLATDDHVHTAREAVLEQMIKHGAIKSFEFALRHRLLNELLFQSHVYFGARLRGQDSLVHFKTYLENGGASQASRFLAEALGVL